MAIHAPQDVPWETLSERMVLQLHWHRSEDFRKLLRSHNFRVVTIARHPLDTLISILQFSPYEPQTAQWLGGTGGNESSIHGKSPSSQAFLTYCASQRASALLEVSPQWWCDPEVVRVKYEDLVERREETLNQLAVQLELPVSGISHGPEAFDLASLRRTSKNNHFWQGRPGLWRQLFTREDVQKLQMTHRHVFECLGYSCQFDSSNDEPTSLESIDLTWRVLTTNHT